MAQISFGLEVKALNKREFEGHGSVFGNVDLGGDVVVPGAFSKSLKAHNEAGTLPQMFWMHQPDKVPGKWLEMTEDKKGLFVRGELVDTELGREMRTLLGAKAVRGLSIGYSVSDTGYDKQGNRLLKEIDLWEVSLVSLAMNPLAEVEGMKSRLSRDCEYVPETREFEQILRKAGLTQICAKRVISAVRGVTEQIDRSEIRDVDRALAGIRDVDLRRDVDPEEAKLLEMLSQRTDTIWSAAFRNKTGL